MLGRSVGGRHGGRPWPGSHVFPASLARAEAKHVAKCGCLPKEDRCFPRTHVWSRPTFLCFHGWSPIGWSFRGRKEHNYCLSSFGNTFPRWVPGPFPTAAGHAENSHGPLNGRLWKPAWRGSPARFRCFFTRKQARPSDTGQRSPSRPNRPRSSCALLLRRRRRTSPLLRSPHSPPPTRVAFAHHVRRTLLVLHCCAPHQVSPPLHHISMTCVSPPHLTPFLVDNGDEELQPRMEDDLTQEGSLIEDLIRLYHFSGGSSRSTRWALLV